MRRVVLMLAGSIGLGMLLLALLLLWAHHGIRAVRPALPEASAIAGTTASADLPIGLFLIETARQAMPRSSVIEPALDPTPDADYVMTHPAFVLAWPDGRLFLFDAGMDRATARSFGAALERFGDADPIEVLAPAAERLGPAVARVAGAVLGHMAAHRRAHGRAGAPPSPQPLAQRSS